MEQVEVAMTSGNSMIENVLCELCVTVNVLCWPNKCNEPKELGMHLMSEKAFEIMHKLKYFHLVHLHIFL